MALHKPPKTYLLNNLEKNISLLQNYVGDYGDMVIRRIEREGCPPAAVIYFDGMTDKDAVSEFIIKPLLRCAADNLRQQPEDIAAGCLLVADWQSADNVQDFMDSLFSGNCGLLFDGTAAGLFFDLKGFERRGIAEPQTEIVVRGSREGFIENLKTNMSLLRRRIKTPNLCFENMKLGTETNTNICLAYIRGLADPDVIAEARRRLQAIEIDSILESGYIEQLVEDEPWSPFPTIANSEKPDKVAAKLLEGRVAVLVDGTPFVLTAPMLFMESFQSAEDYYARPFMASMVRFLRFISFIFAVYGPALYIAVCSFHIELLPTNLMLNIWQSAGETPLSAGWSVFFYSLVYEVVREAGIRLPRPVGAAISIVGGLVIGDMAVSAGLISAPVVIIVAFTAIAMFVVDALTDAATVLRFGFILLAWWLGFGGLLLGTLLLLLHLVNLKSFGVAYMAPFAPLIPYQLRDSLVRFPWWLLGRRPQNLTVGSFWRQKAEQPPVGSNNWGADKE
ncbi:MAG: spore germination protein [Firmicutes bacterium]|nr:spore germination protein [Bacillota bacterium]